MPHTAIKTKAPIIRITLHKSLIPIDFINKEIIPILRNISEIIDKGFLSKEGIKKMISLVIEEITEYHKEHLR